MAVIPSAFGRFFLPGPTEVRPEVLNAQALPVIPHRGRDIQELMGELQEGLRQIFRTERPVFVSTSSATGLMEAGVRNGVRSRVLCLVNGAFSDRFPRIARACGLHTETWNVSWGEHHDEEGLRRRLREGDVDAVTVAHSETSTGALNPIEKLSRVVREFEDTILIVDSVTGIGGAELHTDDWKLDFVLTGSQKALALPPGLSFGVASAAMMERSERSTHKGFYFDLTLLQRYLDRLQTPTTPAISLMFALREQLGFIASEGMEARWDRHRQMASRCWEWVEHARRARGLPLEVLAAPGYRSPTVTCIRLPEGRSGPEVASRLRERGFVIGAGYGRLKEGTIRIGHMGEHTLAELETLLEALEEVLTA